MTKFKLNHWVTMRISFAIVTLLPICTTVPEYSQWEQEILASTEIPVEHINPGSIDLTPLINTILNASHAGSEHLFSVVSVTSHSSLELHKITLLVYNISGYQDIETSVFPRRYCYCVTNKTNDLTGFTAILLDVLGNSTSYLQELFKSSSILSVSQVGNSDCIYMCVMAGKTDRDQPELWDSVSLLFNQTIIEHTHTAISADFPSSSTIHPAGSVTSSTMTPTTEATPYTTLGVPTTVHTVAGLNTTSIALTTVPTITVPVSVLLPTSDTVPTATQTLPARSTSFPPEPPATTTTQPSHSTVSMTTTSSVLPTTADTATEISTTIPVKPAATKTSPATSKPPRIDKPELSALPPRLKSCSTVATGCCQTWCTSGCASSCPLLPFSTIPWLRKYGCPWRSELMYKQVQREDQKETLDEEQSANSPTISTRKLQPCVFELCKFFSQCICRGFSQKTSLQRYCTDSHFWYERHTVEICSRMKRVTYSKSLKQKCLEKMCVKM